LQKQQTCQFKYLEGLFHLPLCQQAFSEFEDLEKVCDLTSLKMQGDIDTWSYIWGSEKFTAKQAYKALIGHQAVPPHFKWIWNSSCQARHKFLLASVT
jgi:hypothetical protein